MKLAARDQERAKASRLLGPPACVTEESFTDKEDLKGAVMRQRRSNLIWSPRVYHTFDGAGGILPRETRHGLPLLVEDGRDLLWTHRIEHGCPGTLQIRSDSIVHTHRLPN